MMKKGLSLQENRRKQGFSLIELLVVVGIIVILMGFIMTMVGAGKRAADSAKCSKVVSQLTAAWYLYAGDNDQLMAWSGNKQNYFSDWVWGGNTFKQVTDPKTWGNADFGFHAEAGSMFTHVTGLPKIRLEDPGPVRSGSRWAKGKVDEGHKATYTEFRCPNSGEYEALAKAQGVNYSINNYIDYYEDLDNPTKSPDEQYLVNVRRPSQKILLVDEDPRSMNNASFHPGGSADNDNYDTTSLFSTHADKVNLSFIDGHVERWSKEDMLVKQRNAGKTISIDGVSHTAEANYLYKHWEPRRANYQ